MPVIFKSNRAAVEALMQKTVRSALDTVGDQAVGWAQDLAPVDTGNLKSSLDHQEESNDTEIVGASNEKAPYKDVDYAICVELGTHRMHAQPFLRPAIENNLRTIQQIVEDAFSDAFR